MTDNFFSQRDSRITNKILRWFYSSQVNTLVDTLTRAEVHPRSYTLFDMRDESTCLIFENGEYHLFYYEKGQRTNETCFGNLFDGIDGFVNELFHMDKEQAKSVFRDFFWIKSEEMEITGEEAREIEEVINEEMDKGE